MLNENQRGFTVIETLVSLAIAGTILFSVVSNASELYGSFNRHHTLQQFQQDIVRFRSETLAAGARGIANIALDGTFYTFGIDYLPFSSDGTADEITIRRSLPQGVSVSVTDQIIFNARGELVDLDDELNTVSFSLVNSEATYCSGLIYAEGSIEYSC